MTADGLEYKIAFSQLKGLTLALGKQMLALTGSEENFFKAGESSLRALVGGRSAILSEGVRRAALEAAKREAAFVRSNNITPLYFTDPRYPARLLDCDDSPLMLYTIGTTDLNAAHIVSIVGTRHATPYGVSFINSIVADLARRIDNLVIVSGLAYGSDITAHRAALADGVPTVAVVAHGLSIIYPAAHRNDAAAIVRSGGMIVSEYVHDAQVHRGNFLARNRIVAALADCLVVSESAVKGGALVTAKIASAYSRDVAALPGRSSDIYSQGCNSLIRNNMAALVENADDIIALLNWTARPDEGTQSTFFPELSAEEQSIVDYLRLNDNSRLNRISVDLDIPVSRLMSVLVDLEFKGVILNYPGGMYRLA